MPFNTGAGDDVLLGVLARSNEVGRCGAKTAADTEFCLAANSLTVKALLWSIVAAPSRASKADCREWNVIMAVTCMSTRRHCVLTLAGWHEFLLQVEKRQFDVTKVIGSFFGDFSKTAFHCMHIH